jgi:two-component system, sensor histidine kinase PdtaS
MQPTYPSITLEDLGPEDHLCFLFDSEQEKSQVVLAFVKLGLRRTEKVIYVKGACQSETIMEQFNDDDLDAEHHILTGQLRITNFAELSMYSSIFDPDRMLRLLQNETEISLGEGWHGLRIAIEMTWVLKGLPGSSRLVEFESKANAYYCHSKCLAMCLYDLRYFSPLQLLYVLATHPTVIFRGQVCDNIFYRIPQSFITRKSALTVLNDWLHELGKRSRVEVA